MTGISLWFALDSWTFGAIGDVSTSRWWAIVLGVLAALVAITLLVASWTRWGQTKSLTKCIALAFLAHVWLLMYAYGTRILTPGVGPGISGGPPSSQLISVVIESEHKDALKTIDESEAEHQADPAAQESAGGSTIEPWEAPIRSPEWDGVSNLDLPKSLTEIAPQARLVDETVSLAELPATVPDDMLLQQFLSDQNAPKPPATTSAEASSIPGNTRVSDPALQPNSVPNSVAAQAPSVYQNRFSPNRMELVRAGGGDESTETAVQMALEWLARAQSKDGGWYASEHGAGSEATLVRVGPDGELRKRTGARANTAMTGLALLAFLGAGHTHLDGRYAPTIQAGLRYLLSQQFPSSGDLAGLDQVGRDDSVRFARMYSHGMAGLALAEAYSITRDPALLSAVHSACNYSIAAMNTTSGGWRYEYPTSDPGDTSQFGWQAMLLTSAHRGGVIQLPSDRRILMQRFLDSVAAGKYGGLATYRPRRGPYAAPELATNSMTAEAMASRLLLGFPVSKEMASETQKALLTQLPGQGQENFYYWYYATLALFQMRGTGTASAGSLDEDRAWERWNEAIKKQLCSTQVVSGTNQGSWNPTCVWGAYGGRVYSTSIGCLCLEVYYRYLPTYSIQQTANSWQPFENPRR